MAAEPSRRTARGNAIACPVCRGSEFHSERYLLNTRAATFFNVDWANRSATALVCAACSHILWFADEVDPQA